MKRLLGTLLMFAAVTSAIAANPKLWKARDPIANEYIVVLTDQSG